MPQDIHTTARETFSGEESSTMAYLVWKRFGRDYDSAASAWRRLLQNGCDRSAFEKLLCGKDMPANRPTVLSLLERPSRQRFADELTHLIAEALEEGAPPDVVLGEGERAIIKEVIEAYLEKRVAR